MKNLMIPSVIFILSFWLIVGSEENHMRHEIHMEGEDTSATMEIEFNPTKEEIRILIGDIKDNKGGKTLIDFKKHYIAIRIEDNKCYLFPISPSATYNNTRYFLHSPQNRGLSDFFIMNVSAVNPYRIGDIAYYGSSISDWCAGAETWGVFTVYAEDLAARVFLTENKKNHSSCLFMGLVFAYGHELIACFRAVHAYKDILSYKLNFGVGSGDMIVSISHNPKASPAAESYKLIEWFIVQPENMFSEEMNNPYAIKSLFDSTGFASYKNGFEAIVNVNSNECLVKSLENVSMETDIKSVYSPPKINVAKGVVCEEAEEHLNHLQDELFRLARFECQMDSIVSVKNCKYDGTDGDYCLFKGYIHADDNVYSPVCIKDIIKKKNVAEAV